MDAQKVDMFLVANAKCFESYHVNILRDKLLSLDDSNWVKLQSVSLKDPTTVLLVSIFAGGLGIDRFMIGDTGLGIGKLLTCGGFGIWTIVDWFSIQSATKEKNLYNIQEVLR
ncbi:TM2 domain-containing protein [Aureivirga sp. CE67]|uniref:TM2 domain-containing protein n=1 Tax=Aureivirga sp. CE67 TaxID=1788983 RepID=UPI0018CB7490|nr:TM2 domain-containing protein [Aureivirga sp. CE67]